MENFQLHLLPDTPDSFLPGSSLVNNVIFYLPSAFRGTGQEQSYKIQSYLLFVGMLHSQWRVAILNGQVHYFTHTKRAGLCFWKQVKSHPFYYPSFSATVKIWAVCSWGKESCLFCLSFFGEQQRPHQEFWTSGHRTSNLHSQWQKTETCDGPPWGERWGNNILN